MKARQKFLQDHLDAVVMHESMNTITTVLNPLEIGIHGKRELLAADISAGIQFEDGSSIVMLACSC
ncbi:hypothetical protein CIPAW_01G134000 [Carya illinoinensis]|uniref:Uncharacterized protein n=1 Tax=Carya illinoinensis TaxID=32201 RepID=A0A8T1RMP1_CARIL|nr:hypothetical protein CIPAW_01G134000 [Carya illinoinensis]